MDGWMEWMDGTEQNSLLDIDPEPTLKPGDSRTRVGPDCSNRQQHLQPSITHFIHEQYASGINYQSSSPMPQV